MSSLAKGLTIINQIRTTINEKLSNIGDQLKEKEEKIQEIELYLKKISEKEDADFKLFSPRNVESVYREDIEKHQIQIDILEEERKKLYKKKGYLAEELEQLGIVYEEIIQDEQPEITKNESNGIESLEKYKEYGTENVDYRFMLIDMQERERQRIARDLHDYTVQNLTHIIHMIELSGKFLEQDPIRAKLEMKEVSSNLRAAINELRDIIFNLRPISIDDFGYDTAYIRMKEHLEGISNMKVELHIDNIPCKHKICLMVLYRIIQEFCVNAIKHSGGTKVVVSLLVKGELVFVTIKDDGVGFDLDMVQSDGRNNLGLEMAEENIKLLKGTLKIVTKNNEGTAIYITLPVNSVISKGE